VVFGLGYFFLEFMSKLVCQKLKSENIMQKKKCVQNYNLKKRRSEDSSRSVYSADLEDRLGKEQKPYRR